MPNRAQEEKSGPATALEHFKDWSNYLLLATVAAMGWIAESKSLCAHELLKELAVWSFGISLIFGILTLAIVPLVAERITSATESIYEVEVNFKLFRVDCSAYLTMACRPQHILFMAGVIFYGLAVTGTDGLPVFAGALAIGSIVLGFFSRPSRK